MAKILIETDADAFLASIARWDGASPSFQELMPSALLLWCTNDGSNQIFFRALLYEFECGGSTVRRWSSGVSPPMPRMQQIIVKFVHEILSKRRARAKKAHARAYAAWRQFNLALQAVEEAEDDPSEAPPASGFPGSDKPGSDS